MSGLVVTLADTVLGYGSPQIAQFTSTLCEILNSQGMIFQPFVAQRPVVAFNDPLWSLETIVTDADPYSVAGRREFLETCAVYLNKHKPDVIVLTYYDLFDIIDGLTYQPKKIIHLALEDLELTMISPLGKARIATLRRQSKQVDVWLFPERYRAEHDMHILELPFEKIALLYNTMSVDFHKPESRNGRMIYAGTMDYNLSIARYIFDPEFASLPVDVFGDLQGNQESQDIITDKLDVLKRMNNNNHVHWFGQIPSTRLNEILPFYCYSLVFWLPIRHALLYASPNKFFQAIVAGVPVISAPHPQAKMLIERYGCGVLLDGWEKCHLLDGMKKAHRMIGTSTYEDMARNCRSATQKELSWEAQMSKLEKMLRA